MRHAIRLFVASLLIFCIAADDGGESPSVPKEVAYKTASAEINAKAVDIIKKTLVSSASDEQVIAFFDDRGMVCAPGLWRDLKDDTALAQLTLGDAKLTVPYKDKDGKTKSDTMIGKVFHKREDRLALWKAFSTSLDLKHVKIRKLTTQELSFYWSIIFFDITEPVFIAECGDRRVLLQFTSPDDLRVTWIDDLSDYITSKPPTSAPDGEN